MTAIEKLKEVSAILKGAGIENSAKEAEILITASLQISKSRLYTDILEISDKVSKQIDSLLNRRLQGEPVQYIIGYVDFYGLKVNVGKGVLIPRPETELLVQETIKALSRVGCQVSDKEIQNSKFKIQDAKIKMRNSRFKIQNSKLKTQESKLKIQDAKLKILDLCTGSGCIAIALARHFPYAEVYGVDISDIAIGYAFKNAKENNVRNVHFIKGDLFCIGDISKLLTQPPVSPFVSLELKDSTTFISQSAHFSLFTFHSFDLIVSNPPYIKRAEISNLQREIRDYEPIEALDGGEDGLHFYRRIINEAPMFLKEKGLLILELGINQSDKIKQLAEIAGFKEVEFIKDYAGIERIFLGRII